MIVRGGIPDGERVIVAMDQPRLKGECEEEGLFRPTCLVHRTDRAPGNRVSRILWVQADGAGHAPCTGAWTSFSATRPASSRGMLAAQWSG